MGDMHFEMLRTAALELPAMERAQLLSCLINSLEQDEALEAEWDALAAAREAEIETGQASLQDAQQVLQNLRAALPG